MSHEKLLKVLGILNPGNKESKTAISKDMRGFCEERGLDLLLSLKLQHLVKMEGRLQVEKYLFKKRTL